MTRRPPALYTEMRFTGTKDEINDQWKEARKSGIGGSDVASIMGLNKYSSPLEVWLIKTGKQEAPDLSDKQAVEWGNILEDVVADKFKADHFSEYKVFRKNAMLVSKERPWAFANLDRYIIDRDGRRGVLEIKTAGLYRADDWDDGVPLYYLTQVTHYLDVTGFDFAMVAVLIGGQDYREYYLLHSLVMTAKQIPSLAFIPAHQMSLSRPSMPISILISFWPTRTKSSVLKLRTN